MRRTWLATGALGLCVALVVGALAPRTQPHTPPSRASGASPIRANLEAPPAAPRVEPSPAPSPALHPSALHGVYEVSFSHRLTLGDAPLLELRAAGRLDLVAVPQAEGLRLEQRYRFAERASSPESAPELPAELSLAAEVDRLGVLRRLGVPAADAEARNLARALWAAVDVRWPRASERAWSAPALAAGASGADAFTLTQDAGDDVLRRSRRLSALPDGTALSGGGELELRLRAGALIGLRGDERSAVETPDGLLVAETAVRWTRIGDAPEAGDLALRYEAEPRYEAAPALEPPTRELPALLQDLERAVRLGLEREALALFDALARRLTQHPDEVALALRAIRDGGLPLGAQRTLVDALGASGSPAAQRALVSLLDDALPGLDGNLYLALGGQPELVLEASARLGVDVLTSTPRGAWARVAAGIQLVRGEAPPAALREALLESLAHGVPADQVLEALAQSGDPALLELLVEREGSADPALRAAAAEALRNVNDPEADSRLLALAADPAPAVQRAALD
ncbi:MAG: HEAT repeat domain-containing protein, partial [Planctomycetes bacterium]|nr:HEAT repeat domain-containing protein [Planctomycetota bacterium]